MDAMACQPSADLTKSVKILKSDGECITVQWHSWLSDGLNCLQAVRTNLQSTALSLGFNAWLFKHKINGHLYVRLPTGCVLNIVWQNLIQLPIELHTLI